MPRRREAPITATERGARKRRTAATAAVRSRSSKRSRAAGDTEVGNSISIASGVERVSIANPLWRKTSIIRWLAGRTSATNVAIPCWSAICASCASMIEEMPRPCQWSATRNATSARSALIRAKAAWEMIWLGSPVSAISATRSA